MRKTHNDISVSADVSPVTWKFSGQEKDKGALNERGMIGNRSEGRTDNLEPVDGGRGLGMCRGLDRTAGSVLPKPNAWDADGSLMRSRTDELGLDRVRRPICGSEYLGDASKTSAVPNNSCENDLLFEGPDALSGSSEATLSD